MVKCPKCGTEVKCKRQFNSVMAALGFISVWMFCLAIVGAIAIFRPELTIWSPTTILSLFSVASLVIAGSMGFILCDDDGEGEG